MTQKFDYVEMRGITHVFPRTNGPGVSISSNRQLFLRERAKAIAAGWEPPVPPPVARTPDAMARRAYLRWADKHIPGRPIRW